MKNIPEKIYLQIGFEPDETDDFKKLSLADVTWSDDRMNDSDLEFGYIPKPEPTTILQKIIMGVVLGMFIYAVGGAFWHLYSRTQPRVTQELFIDSRGEPSLPTLVWADGKIIRSWFDPVEISDSLKKARMAEAQRILKTIK